MKAALSLGMVVGQLVFGVLGDAWGRKAIYGKELLITLFGTLMIVLLPWKGLSHEAIVAWISVFRVISGVGIGAGTADRMLCNTKALLTIVQTTPSHRPCLQSATPPAPALRRCSPCFRLSGWATTARALSL